MNYATPVNQQNQLRALAAIKASQELSESNHSLSSIVPISERELRYRKKHQTFVQKLYYILSFEIYSSIISWNLNGLCWRIHNKNAFINNILPMLCESVKWKSFLRQLSGWGFKRGNST